MALNNQSVFFSQFCRLPIQYGGVSRLGFFEGLSPWLADGHLLAVSLRGLCSVYIYLWYRCV